MANPITQGGDGACRRIGGTVFLPNIRSHVRGVRPSMGAFDQLVNAARVEHHIGVGDNEKFGMNFTSFYARNDMAGSNINGRTIAHISPGREEFYDVIIVCGLFRGTIGGTVVGQINLGGEAGGSGDGVKEVGEVFAWGVGHGNNR